MTGPVDSRQAQMIAIRELYERQTPSFLRLAAATGMSASGLKERARREGWTMQSTGRPRRAAAEPESAATVLPEDYAAADGEGSPEERLKRVMDLLLREVEAIGHAARRQGVMPDKARMDAAWSLIRTLEKADELVRERAGGEQAKRDEEMGDVLRRIDARIEELARAYARELGAGGMGAEGMGGGEPQRG